MSLSLCNLTNLMIAIGMLFGLTANDTPEAAPCNGAAVFPVSSRTVVIARAEQNDGVVTQASNLQFRDIADGGTFDISVSSFAPRNPITGSFHSVSVVDGDLIFVFGLNGDELAISVPQTPVDDWGSESGVDVLLNNQSGTHMLSREARFPHNKGRFIYRAGPGKTTASIVDRYSGETFSQLERSNLTDWLVTNDGDIWRVRITPILERIVECRERKATSWTEFRKQKRTTSLVNITSADDGFESYIGAYEAERLNDFVADPRSGEIKPQTGEYQYVKLPKCSEVGHQTNVHVDTIGRFLLSNEDEKLYGMYLMESQEILSNNALLTELDNLGRQRGCGQIAEYREFKSPSSTNAVARFDQCGEIWSAYKQKDQSTRTKLICAASRN